MSIAKLRATRIGFHAHRYLSQVRRTGRTLSTFQHGFNVLFDEHSDPAIVTIQSQRMPLHPWAIEVPDTLPGRDALASCAAEAKSVRFKNGHIVSFAGTAVHKLGIQSWNRDETACVLRNMPIVKATVKASIPVASPIRLEAEIMTILLREQSPDNAKTLGRLVGRGRGSTPAGDDALLGMLAALIAQAATCQHARVRLAALRDELQSADLFKQTTRASAQMLEAGASGSFPEPLCALASSLKCKPGNQITLERAMDRVLGLGASSGQFFLMGFAAILKRLTTG